jgi:hypothetical protein
MIQAFSFIFDFFNKASPCGDMSKIFVSRFFVKLRFIPTLNAVYLKIKNESLDLKV